MQGIPLLVVTCGLLYIIRQLVSAWNAIRSIGNLPGYRTLFSYDSPVAMFTPAIAGLSPGSNHFFRDKHTIFKSAGWDMHSFVSIVPKPITTVTLADADAIKEVTSSRARFPKPVSQYEILTFFGRNIVASEGEEWKKYRKISAPAFTDRNNKLVWDETVHIMGGLFNEVWKDKDEISVDHCLEITLPTTLFVIAGAGFGRKMSWNDDGVIPAGHQMTFKNSFRIASSDIIFKALLPDWALKFGPARLRKVKTAFDELGAYMSEMVKERYNSEKVERDDLFSNLLEANGDDLDAERLTESELIGNIYIFLLAGHETTAHTLCFTFALLAFHPDEQERLFEHIKSILPDGRIPTYEEMPLLTHSMAVLNETLRLFPTVVNIPKYSAEDTVLSVGNANDEKRTVPIPKGTRISICTPGLHYNPRYWDDPESFKPSRFLKSDWPRDAFAPFSIGARACLGRKFAETEAIAVITMLVSRYKISVKKEPQFAGETFEQCKTRVFKANNMLTLTPTRAPLTFTRRT